MSDLPVSDTIATPVRHELDELLGSLGGQQGPLLSLYLDVYAGNDPNAPRQRADGALRALPLGRDARGRFERQLLYELRGASEGTLVAFLDEDPKGLLATRLLKVAPPLPGGSDPAAARWGDAWTAPLELLMACEDPVVAVFADERRARVFVQDLGEVSEASAYVRAMDPGGWRRYSENATGVPGTPARGGSGQDDFASRTEAWTARFVADVIVRVESAVAAHDGTRLVLLGDDRRRSQLQEALPVPLKGSLLGSGPAPADPDLDVARWSEPLGAFVREALHQEDRRMLAELESSGVSGTGEVLAALSRGELATVVIGADVDVDVVRCLGTDWLAESEEAARRVCPDGPIERTPLKQHLTTTAKRGRARIRVLRGPDEEALLARIGPVAGLPRRG